MYAATTWKIGVTWKFTDEIKFRDEVRAWIKEVYSDDLKKRARGLGADATLVVSRRERLRGRSLAHATQALQDAKAAPLGLVLAS